MNPRRLTLVLSALCVIIAASLICPAAMAADWPAHLHDNARSGISTDTVTLPLEKHWVFAPEAPPQPAWTDPHSIPIEGVLESPRVKFDDTFEVAVADGMLYFSSSADNEVFALDAATGEIRWSFFTGGPVRLAPCVSKHRVYFGSDDGYAYCLSARDGSLIWKKRGGPTDERVLGHGKMISLWPLRTGVIVDGDTAYFTAGIFPGERIYVHAVRADSGASMWTNDTISDRASGRDGFSPQGYLLASDSTLYIPSGRSLPAAFDRKDGRFLYQKSASWRSLGVIGGTYALLAGDQLYSGTEQQVISLDQKSGSIGFAWFPGRRLVVSADTSYMLDDSGTTALDRVKYPELSRNRRSLASKRSALVKSKPEDLEDRLKVVDAEIKANEDALAACTRWTLEREGLRSMIVTESVVFAGGAEEVIAIDRSGGGVSWRGVIDGTATGLAAADGRLYVSADNGKTYCFGAGAAHGSPTRIAPPAAPFPRHNLDTLCEKAAKQIIRDTGITRGHCLVLGCSSGRLALGLARRTDLQVHVVDPDPERVRVARESFAAAGLYGTRVVVDCGDPDDLPYSDYFANLIVSEDVVLGGEVRADPAELLRVLKPCGGVLCIGRPESDTAPGRLSPASLRAALAGMPDLEITQHSGVWARCVRGGLEGAGQWTHQYGDPGNTASSKDQIVKCPLGVLWYGEPGPNTVPSRHAGNAAPLTIDGRVYLQGINRIMCFDAYNGLMYWDRKIKGAYRVSMIRDCSNLACDGGSLFVATGEQCLRLDAETGETVTTYAAPVCPDGKGRTWRYVALVGNTLFGSLGTGSQYSQAVFAMDTQTGDVKWMYLGRKVRNNSIAISDGRVFFADDRATAEERKQALAQRTAELRRKMAEAAGAGAKTTLEELDSKPLYAAPRFSPQVDGDLGDWSDIASAAMPRSDKGPGDLNYPEWRGKNDLSGRFYMGWDEKNLYFAAAVTDDVFNQPFAGDNIWEADCIQVAMDLLRTGSYDREYGLALSPGGPFTWCWYGPASDAARITLKTHKRADGVDYEAAIPWEVLAPLTPAAGKALGFTAAVMDSDGGAREGHVSWTPGIANGKLPSAFGTVLLARSQSEADVLAARDEVAPPTTEEKELAKAEVWVAVALDADSGETAWEKPVDLTDCGGHVLSAIATKGVLVFCGSHYNGHFWPQFLGGQYADRRAVAVSMKDGAPLWDKAIGYRIRPLVVGDEFIAEPWSFDIHTGEQIAREHPITGQPSVWKFERPGHHCGTISGSPHALFFRSATFAYYDLDSDFGTQHFGGQRPGCWINMIPANGLVVVPEASSGCICLFSIHCTTVFKPRETNKTWGMFSCPGDVKPVKQLRVNLGAPGDRADASGKRWFAFPRPSGRMQMKFDLSPKPLPGGGYFSRPNEACTVAGTDDPFLYASGYAGLVSCTVPLVGDDDGPALYTVRLGFADTENRDPGSRVFDIKLQDEMVEAGFDIIRAAGGPNRAVVMEYTGIEVDGALKIGFVPWGGDLSKSQQPLLNTIEIVRERVLHVGLAAPSFTLSDLDTKRAGDIRIANRTEEEFVGALQIASTESFEATPGDTPIKLAPNERMTVPITVRLAKKGKAGEHRLDAKLVRQDGATEAHRACAVTYLGARGRLVVKVAEDAYVSCGSPTKNYGHDAALLVDGGAATMGDESHNIAYLKFRLDIPGKPISALLRLRTTAIGHSQSGDSGRIHLVDKAWGEYTIQYSGRPEPGKEVGSVGRVGNDVWEERPLNVDLTGRRELNLVLEPTTCDGATYFSREGGNGPELVIEYAAEE